MSESINNNRKPTAIDRKILEWLKSGQSINHITALNKFKTTMLRDSIWRLIKDGEPIQSKWMHYKTNEGTTKKFKEYFIQPPEILQAGQKTEVNYKKEKSSTEYAAEILNKTKSHIGVQPELFKTY